MIDAPLSFAYSAGAVAAFNPCGFALLPAYLGLFLAGDADHDGTGDVRGAATVRAWARAAAVAVAVATGFVAVFGVAAVLISQTAVTVQRYTPWATLVIGIALVPAGLAILAGWTPKLRLPRAGRRQAGGTGAVAMFWFGVSYATVSLSCTIPAFLVAVVGTFAADGAGSGVLVVLAYAAGMVSVLLTVTVVVATARQGALAYMRRVLPYVNTTAGALAAIAGAYVAYYGWYEIQVNGGGDPPDGPLALVGRGSGRITSWVDAVPPLALFAVASAAAIGISLTMMRTRKGDRACRR